MKRHYNPRETLDIMRNYFAKQIDLFEEFSETYFGEKHSNKLHELVPLVYGIITSGKAIKLLFDARLANKIFIISRSFLEKCINLCYLMVCSKDEFQNYIYYSLQKGYRAICSKQKSASLLGIEAKDIEPSERLSEKIKRFSSQKGREITRWTKLSFNARVEYIQKETNQLGESSRSIYKYIYEDSSEASHGTMYGSLFHTGVLSGAICEIQGSSFITHYVAILLFNFGTLIDAIFNIGVSKVDVTLNKFVNISSKNGEMVSKWFNKINI
jgi:hypothetical protein